MEKIIQKQNSTGLPDRLKSGVENLSGYSMDEVKVHHNSNKAAQLNARAFAQGIDIHIAGEQEKHLTHESWHLTQQKQGRAKPIPQINPDVPINQDKALEEAADQMGRKALEI